MKDETPFGYYINSFSFMFSKNIELLGVYNCKQLQHLNFKKKRSNSSYLVVKLETEDRLYNGVYFYNRYNESKSELHGLYTLLKNRKGITRFVKGNVSIEEGIKKLNNEAKLVFLGTSFILFFFIIPSIIYFIVNFLYIL